MSIRISAVYDSTDRAELAIRSLLDSGIRIYNRKITPLYSSGGDATSGFFFAPMGTTGYFENGIGINGGFMNEPGFGVALYTDTERDRMGVMRGDGPYESVQLEVEVDEARAQDAVAIMTSAHGSYVKRY